MWAAYGGIGALGFNQVSCGIPEMTEVGRVMNCLLFYQIVVNGKKSEATY